MSQQNVEVAREAIKAWNAGDMERLAELYDPDAIVRAPPDWPEPGVGIGRNAIMQAWSQLREIWDIDSMDIADELAAGDRVILRVTWRGTARGLQTAKEYTFVYTVRRGLILGLEFFLDHSEALEAAGLRE